MIWTGACDKRGYGRTSYNGRRTSVHRAAWIERHGSIPAETPHVLHRCDNPPCWRDDHLFLGTPADNAADREAKGRGSNGQVRKTACPQGHAYDYVDPRGNRGCRRCRHASQERWKEERNAARRARRANPRG